ncbi:MAG TPA: ABC transporter ATP-binding protein/permease [Burkholderiaceae bacterium]|nr:ABC transporter ATP-binding protein/permease [Burkholderiaceae bacterium]
MRRAAVDASAAAGPAAAPRARSSRSDWQTLRTLIPYLWQFKGRVLLAITFLVAAKVANLGVPLVLKQIVDALVPAQPGEAPDAAAFAAAVLAVPVALIAAYGALRLSSTVFTELREYVFAKVTQRAVRTIALQVFRHLHSLSLRFHLDRQTGGLTRDIERGSRGISSLMSYTLYSILPTLVEISLVLGYLLLAYEPSFAIITGVALVAYVAYTVIVTEWRTNFRRTMNELNTQANVRAIDSLLNYETVKYFGNEEFEARRYDEGMQRWERAAIRSQTSLSLLNAGQAAIIAIAVTLIVWRATVGVVEGRMSIGDLVLVNAFMIQLYIPLNFLGVLYREIKQSLADMERMFSLLHANREVADTPGAQDLRIAGPEVRFENVSFAYDPARPILQGISFTMAPGTTTAVVGSSGAGKSTLARLLFRFYDVGAGRITIDGQDIRDVTQTSLRRAIGIVPQDTVLFNDTIRYNIAYGRPDATDDEVQAATDAAQLTRFIASLPAGFQTSVGERGLKLSGGEKQRVAIARMLLKNPPILILDEATSALDSRNEQAIQEALRAVSAQRTTLVIAHRLSTIVEADQIVVLERGCIVETGRHDELLARGGRYAELWAMQAREQEPAQPHNGR